MKEISRLHFITTNVTLAEQAIAGGVDWVQLRMKNVTYEEYKQMALEVQKVCKQHGAILIINDNVELAADINANGVHIGKDDITPEAARALLGNEFIIGCTANTPEDVARLSALPIDYIGLGPFRFTDTKENLSPILGLGGYAKIVGGIKGAPPIIGIGGITKDDVMTLMATGLHGIAVSGAIGNAADVAEAAKQFKQLLTTV